MSHTVSLHYCPQYLKVGLNRKFESKDRDSILNMNFTADKNKFDSLLLTNQHDTDKDCRSFMDFIRKEVTGDEYNYVSGDSNPCMDTYFYRILSIRWHEHGLWCFCLWFDKEVGNEKDYLLHAWVVANTKEKGSRICMTSRMESRIIPFSYFQEMFRHVDYEKWMQSLEQMIRHVQQKGFDNEAVILYDSLFGIRNLPMNRKNLVLLWKWYPWGE